MTTATTKGTTMANATTETTTKKTKTAATPAKPTPEQLRAVVEAREAEHANATRVLAEAQAALDAARAAGKASPSDDTRAAFTAARNALEWAQLQVEGAHDLLEAARAAYESDRVAIAHTAIRATATEGLVPRWQDTPEWVRLLAIWRELGDLEDALEQRAVRHNATIKAIHDACTAERCPLPEGLAVGAPITLQDLQIGVRHALAAMRRAGAFRPRATRPQGAAWGEPERAAEPTSRHLWMLDNEGYWVGIT